MNSTSIARVGRLALAALTSLAVLAAVLAVLTRTDPADADPHPVAMGVTFNGIGARAANYVDSTVTLCPQATTVALRLRDRATGRPLSGRPYTIYYSSDGSQWLASSGTTSRRGRVAQRITGRLSGLQVAAEGYNHYFTVRYRACTSSVAKVRVFKPYGVRGDNRAHVRLVGAVYAQRSNGSTIRFPHGRVEVRETRTGDHIGTLTASADGRFTGDVALTASTRLTVVPASGPTGTRRPVRYGRRWILKPAHTPVVKVPSWMQHRQVKYTVSPAFSPELKEYAGGFADPTILRIGKTYYAASTTGSNLNLPVMTSTNLTTWRPRAALSSYYDYSSWPRYNDAMPQAPAWAARFSTRENVKRISQWAPSLARVGDRRFVAAFSAATKGTKAVHRHSCIGLAVSSAPDGPYRPFARPLLCDRSTPFGVIDPDLFHDPLTHHNYLIWADEGIKHRRKVQLAIRQLDRAGTGWAHGSRRHNLLTFSQRWEGVIMENPSMIRYHHTLYLFYSANKYGTSRYATGYAICKHLKGPCYKPRRRPLLATKGDISGPGGADAFIDAYGHLRLAYAAWRRGHAGEETPGRVLHIATLRRKLRNGHLLVHRMTQSSGA